MFRKYAAIDFEFIPNYWNENLVAPCQVGVYYQSENGSKYFNKTINCGEITKWMKENSPLDQEIINNSPSENQVMSELKEWLIDHQITHLVGYNPNYDNAILIRHNIIYPMEDIQQDCRRIQANLPFPSDLHCSLVKFNNYLKLPKYDGHDALHDSIMTYNIFKKIN